MSTTTLADVVRQLALLADIRGSADGHDLRAALAITDRLSPGALADFEQQIRTGQGADAHGFSPAVAARLREIAAGHPDIVLAAARSGVPILLRRLLETGAVTTDQAGLLARDLGVATIADLEAALDDGRLTRLPSPAAERTHAAAPRLLAEHRPLPLGRAYELVQLVLELIDRHGRLVLERSASGDVRRFEPLVMVPAVAAASHEPAHLLDGIADSPDVEDVLYRTARRAIVRVHQHEVDVRIATPDEYGSLVFAATGASAHVRAIAARRPRAALCAREEDVYSNAGLPWIAPELRHDTGEIEAAAARRLPRLLQRTDIRGDLHMHSTYSDGQDTIEAMVLGCLEIGYEYIAITDHSQSAAASRTVTLDQLARQRDEIERLRERHRGIAILHGIEADILPDGRLDFDDGILQGLDIVLASLHDAARHDGATLTRRCLQAIRHPLVNVVTHPANRLVGRRSGYALDYEAIYQAAAETGTALEIDGAPSHLDLDGEHARAAITAGVTVTVDSDCHRVKALEQQMILGVGTARRGWVEPGHVLNCRPLAEVRAFVAAKRT